MKPLSHRRTVGLATSGVEVAAKLRQVLAVAQGLERAKGQPRRPVGDLVLRVVERWVRRQYPNLVVEPGGEGEE